MQATNELPWGCVACCGAESRASLEYAQSGMDWTHQMSVVTLGPWVVWVVTRNTERKQAHTCNSASHNSSRFKQTAGDAS